MKVDTVIQDYKMCLIQLLGSSDSFLKSRINELKLINP